MTTTTGVRQQRQLQTRERLLEAATRVFARHGFDGASVPQIAQDAEMSTGAIYSNFSGKEELFLAMIGRLVEEGAQRRAAAVATFDGDRDGLLDQITGDWIATIDSQPDVVVLMAEFWLYALRRPDMKPMVAAFLAAVRANFSETIDALIDDADDGMRDDLAAGLQALAYGFAMQRLADPEAVPGNQFTRTVHMLIAGAASQSDDQHDTNGSHR